MLYSIEGETNTAQSQGLLVDVEQILHEFGDRVADSGQPSDFRIVVRSSENVDLSMAPTLWLRASADGASVTYRMKHLGRGSFAPTFHVDAPWDEARDDPSLEAVREKVRQFRQLLSAGSEVEPAAVLSAVLVDALGRLLAERDELLRLLLDLQEEHSVALERIEALEGQLAALRLAEGGHSGSKNGLRKAVATALLALLPVAGVLQAARINAQGSESAAHRQAIASVENALISQSGAVPTSAQQVASVRDLATQLVGECDD